MVWISTGRLSSLSSQTPPFSEMAVIWNPTAPGPERLPDTESEKSGLFSQRKAMAEMTTAPEMKITLSLLMGIW
jgi:hypothetical protein